MDHLPVLTAARLRDLIGKVLGDIEGDAERYVITRHGRKVAGIVSLSDLELLCALDESTVRETELEQELALERFRRAKEGALEADAEAGSFEIGSLIMARDVV